MVCGSEIARCVGEFESCIASNVKAASHKHHEETNSFQNRFEKQVLDLLSSFEQAGNPFLEESQDLFVLDSRDVMGENVVNTINTIEEKGILSFPCS
jgi:hypothetical protein